MWEEVRDESHLSDVGGGEKSARRVRSRERE